MSRPGFQDPKAQHNDSYPNTDSDSLVNMGDLPVKVGDVSEVDDFEMRAVDPDEVSVSSMLTNKSLLEEGVAFEPEAMFPHQSILPK